MKRDTEWKDRLLTILVNAQELTKVYGDDITVSFGSKTNLYIREDMYKDNFNAWERENLEEEIGLILKLHDWTKDPEFIEAKEIYENINELDSEWYLSNNIKQLMYEEWNKRLEENKYRDKFQISDKTRNEIEREIYG